MPAPRLSTEPAVTFSPRAFRAAMALAGIASVTKLAEAAGIPRSRVSVILGGYLPNVAQRRRLAALLGLAVSDIWRPAPEAMTAAQEPPANR